MGVQGRGWQKQRLWARRTACTICTSEVDTMVKGWFCPHVFENEVTDKEKVEQAVSVKHQRGRDLGDHEADDSEVREGET